ncbi:MAG: oligosaccharide flippase family protein [Thermodesulfobacteriota bacterium]|nr:oligosaccharide flippase family protein [Thermodesulfobacteriota bacterium]
MTYPSPSKKSSAPISPLNRRLLYGGAWAFAGKIITVISSLAVNFLLARLLTPEEMGAYFLTFSLVSVAAMIAQLGLSQTVVRLVAESIGTGQPGRAAADIRIVFRFGAIGSLECDR